MRCSGSMLCLASAAAFGAMGVFGKLAYGEGATVGTLLAVRFSVAAALLWALLLAGGRAGELRALRRRDLAVALGLGACGYALQAGGYFAALERIDAGLVSLVVYTYPVLVAVAAVALGRERLTVRHLIALGLGWAGLVLVLAGAGTGALDPAGIALALGAASVYGAYILVSEGVVARIGPRVLAALVCSGAAVSLTACSIAAGDWRPGELTAAGWGWLAGLAVVSTVVAMSLLFAGLRRVGPTTASLLSTVEPLVTVVLAYVAFGELLGIVQILGGALVLGGVLVLRVREAAKGGRDEGTIGRQDRAGERGDARRRARDRGRARRGRRHGLRHRPQHARAAL